MVNDDNYGSEMTVRLQGMIRIYSTWMVMNGIELNYINTKMIGTWERWRKTSMDHVSWDVRAMEMGSLDGCHVYHV